MDDHTSTESTSTEDPQPAAKKPYRKPELVKLGSLRDVTKATGYFGQADGGRFPRGFRTGF
jgi:hypothetical protein